MKLHVVFNSALIAAIVSICPASAAENELTLSAVSVQDNVYSIISPHYGRPTEDNWGWNSNSHFVVTNDGVLVVDTGSSSIIGKAIIEAVKSVTDKPIRWVVNSHSHADHWLGNQAFAALGAEIISTPTSLATMKIDGEMDVKAFSRMTNGKTGSPKLTYPTHFIPRNQSRMFGEVEVQFLLSGDGHSPGDLLLWLPQQAIVIGGDNMNSQWLPIMTPRGDVPHLIKTLEHVASLEPKYVLTGHGDITNLDSIVRDIQFLTRAWDSIVSAVKRKESLTDIQLKIRGTLAPLYQMQYQDFDSSIEYFVEMMVQKQTHS
ncbi:MBL fold metallo-hydrolase [Alteromonas facilis]|uniref:MBL fold metallo-hydrolase n=1 Tax=Alteromonas facilis TaxID=2048004 RepID=UPI0013DACBB9|nr:MBL fold metallo-hydrolase [Alteromonas facilis]